MKIFGGNDKFQCRKRARLVANFGCCNARNSYGSVRGPVGCWLAPTWVLGWKPRWSGVRLRKGPSPNFQPNLGGCFFILGDATPPHDQEIGHNSLALPADPGCGVRRGTGCGGHRGPEELVRERQGARWRQCPVPHTFLAQGVAKKNDLQRSPTEGVVGADKGQN